MEEDLGYCTFRIQNISECDRDNQNSLRAAIRDKKVDTVRRLINCGAEANGYPSNIPYQRPLHLAVISRSVELVDILLKGGAKLNEKSQDGDTALTLAAKLENIPVIDLLLSHTTENEQNVYNQLSHLHIACMRNNVDLVRKLLLRYQGKGVNSAIRKDSMCWPGFTPLHSAVQYGSTDTVKFLLKCGADITAKDVRQMTPLHLAQLHRNEEIIDLILMEHKFEHRNPTDAAGLSHFHIACTRDNPLVVEHFLRSNVDLNLEVKSSLRRQWRPIDFALYYECPKVIELLLRYRVNLLGMVSMELLKFVFRMGNKAIYNLVISRGIKFQQSNQTNDDMTFFHEAYIEDSTRKIEELLVSGKICGDFNVPIWSGCTPLHVAVRHNSAAVTKFLLDHGADPMIQDPEGKTSLHISFEYGHDEILKSILETFDRFSHNKTDNSGLSIFHILCSTSNVKAIESLISEGVDINAQVWHDSVRWAGFTPMHFAVQFRQREVVILLVRNNADVIIRNQIDLTPIDLLFHRFDEHFYDVLIERDISEILMTIFSSLHGDIGKSIFEVMSPLHALCINKHTDLEVFEQTLITYKDDINRRVNLPSSSRSHRCTALHLAMQRHHFEMAKLLMEKGANPLLVNGNGETPLETAASSFGLEWEIEEPESLFPLETPVENFKPSHFYIACSLGLTNVVRHVLNKASDPELKLKFINCLDDDARTPLQSLLYVNERIDELPKREITNLLLENGADVNARDFQLKTALHWSEYREDFDVAHALISHGADVNAQDVHGRTPLRALIHTSFIGNNNNGKMIALLLENGADINIVDERGLTCLAEKFGLRQNRHLGDCIVPVLKHIKKLEVIGLPIHDLNKQAYIGYTEEFLESFDERKFVDDCKKELESMKNVKIDNYTVLRDILFKSPHQMVSHCNNEGLESMVALNQICLQFPMYGFLIRLQVRNGKIREPLLRKSEESFRVLTRTTLPPACLESIFQYLCNSDLENILLSSRGLDEREMDM